MKEGKVRSRFLNRKLWFILASDRKVFSLVRFIHGGPKTAYNENPAPEFMLQRSSCLNSQKKSVGPFSVRHGEIIRDLAVHQRWCWEGTSPCIPR